ncbi:MAG: hypothetical protein JW867_01970 [Candidatus Omnitrophica bacterium]|nr:hypothetical protein [Candidatus Omnitrophota bacterium]
MKSLTRKTQYQKRLETMEKRWEDLCIRCGGCCGAFDDPCVYLRKGKDNRYSCSIYPHRLGERVTVAGEKFDCVQLRKIINTHWKNDHLCVYKKILRMPWILEEEA